MRYVYIDESGSEGNDSNYIIFASVSTNDPRALEKAIKKVWKSKPQFHFRGEFHASKLDNSTRKRILMSLTKLNIGVRHYAVNKHQPAGRAIGIYYLGLHRFINQHDAGSRIVVDKKDTAAVRFKTINRLGIGDSFKDIAFDESHKIKQLQAVDIVAWSLGRMYEHDDPVFCDIIKHKESPLF